MELVRAKITDAPALQSFFEKFPISHIASFQTHRGKDFFAHYEIQSPQWVCYILRSRKDQSIHGMVTFILRESRWQGKFVRIAVATDLRISPEKTVLKNWLQYFLPVLREIRTKDGADYIFSSINMMDSGALKNFVRPRPLRRPLPRYFLYRKLSLISIHGRFPWAYKPLPSLRICRANEKILPELINYIVRQNQHKPFSSIWDENSFFQKMRRLVGTKIEDFWIAYDANDQVVGCLSSWSSKGINDLSPLSYSLRAHNFRQFVKLSHYLGFARLLTKPKASTGKTQPLNFRYLTFLNADNADIFESLLWWAYESTPKTEFLVYAACEGETHLRAPPTWITAEIPHALYSLVDPDEKKPDFLDPRQSLHPEIEACWL